MSPGLSTDWHKHLTLDFNPPSLLWVQLALQVLGTQGLLVVLWVLGNPVRPAQNNTDTEGHCDGHVRICAQCTNVFKESCAGCVCVLPQTEYVTLSVCASRVSLCLPWLLLLHCSHIWIPHIHGKPVEEHGKERWACLLHCFYLFDLNFIRKATVTPFCFQVCCETWVQLAFQLLVSHSHPQFPVTSTLYVIQNNGRMLP